MGRAGGREMQEGRDMGTYVYVKLIHFVIKQKLTHHCKAIISNKGVKKKKRSLDSSSAREGRGNLMGKRLSDLSHKE